MRIAFKEWAVVVDGLGRGDQIIILRKGGISEGRSGFQVEHNRFFLFPTLFHQQRECVQPAAQIRYDALAPKLSPNSVLIEFFVSGGLEISRFPRSSAALARSAHLA